MIYVDYMQCEFFGVVSFNLCRWTLGMHIPARLLWPDTRSIQEIWAEFSYTKFDSYPFQVWDCGSEFWFLLFAANKYAWKIHLKCYDFCFLFFLKSWMHWTRLTPKPQIVYGSSSNTWPLLFGLGEISQRPSYQKWNQSYQANRNE